MVHPSWGFSVFHNQGQNATLGTIFMASKPRLLNSWADLSSEIVTHLFSLTY